MTVRTLIADDESLARDRLRALLEEEGDVEVVAEAANGREAVERLAAESPQLVFLDIKMPVLDGLGVVEEVGPSRMPATVFVTAYGDYALDAFDCHAVDYLLKPFTKERLAEAVQRAREHLRSSSNEALGRRLEKLLHDFQAKPEYAERLVVKSARRLVLLKVDTIDWIDAAGNYVRLNARGEQYLMREKISALERQLDPRRFLRIHRSTIVNTDAIREIRSLQHGEGLVVLNDGQRLSLSRSCREKVTALFG